MSPDEQALLERPIADLNLSVRARKCMVRLGISTIGELIRRTGDDLLDFVLVACGGVLDENLINDIYRPLHHLGISNPGQIIMVVQKAMSVSEIPIFLNMIPEVAFTAQKGSPIAKYKVGIQNIGLSCYYLRRYENPHHQWPQSQYARTTRARDLWV